MRKLMWFTIGFSCACAVGTYFYNKWFWLWMILGFLLLAGGILLQKRWNFLRPVVAVALGVVLGLAWFAGYHHFYLKTPTEADGSVREFTAEVTDYSRDSGTGSSVRVKISLDNRTYRAVAYLTQKLELKPGDHIRGSFRLRLTHDGMEDDTYHRGNGIFLLAYAQDSVEYFSAARVGISSFPAMMRRNIAQCLDKAFPEDVAFFAKALLLGDRSDVDYATNTAFKVSGISHIIAVSGLHVSILFSLIYLISGKHKIITAIIGIPLLLLFAAIAGFTPSITRACVMQILIILSMLINREYDPPTALSTAVLLMLLFNPITMASASFQLSVGCMIGIFMFSGKIQNKIVSLPFWSQWKGKTFRVRFRQWIASGVSVTLSSMFFTTPLVAYYFGCISLVSVITNLLTLWIVSFIFYGLLLVCLFSLFWQQGAVLLAWLISWPVRYVIGIAKLLSAIPLAAVYTESIYIVMWIVLCYLLVIVFLMWKQRSTVIVIGCMTLSLIISLFCSWMEPLLTDYRMTVLSVGQGQCILLQSHGKTFVVDCGGDSDAEAADRAAETLLSMGIYRLDGVILTHYDTDHCGGMVNLLSRIPADQVYLPVYTTHEDRQQQIYQAARGHGAYVTEDIRLSWDNSELVIFAPTTLTSENESGLCVLFRGENCDILITGDLSIHGENLLIQNKNIPPLTCFVAGHHGAGSSTGENLLSVLKPTYVFISVGEDNTYGHPDQALMKRLEKHQCSVWRTDLHGDLIFRR